MNSEKKATQKSPRVRRCQMALREKDSLTGAIVLTKEKIESIVNKYNTIERWTYILHDRDVKVNDDELVLDDEGNTIPVEPHFHIVLSFNTPIDIECIAKWFNVPSNMINKINGSKYYGYYECVNYLTHMNFRNKTHYNSSEIHCNYDYDNYIDSMLKKKVKNSRREKENIRDEIRKKVMFDGLSLRKACDLDMGNYINDMGYLQKCRLEYLKNQSYPKSRMNFYIYGSGGVGKDICSAALARALFPNLHDDDEIFFRVGAENATFEGYDGQPVIIWSDFRAVDFLRALKTRGNVFSVLDTFPTSSIKQNIKYSSIKLLNSINIINSVQDFKEFADGLAGEYAEYRAEDKKQAYRRLPIVLPLHDFDFQVLVNKGFFDNGIDYETYNIYASVQGSFSKLHRSGLSDENILSIENKMHKPSIQAYNKAKNINRNDTENIDFSTYGELKSNDNNFCDELNKVFGDTDNE